MVKLDKPDPLPLGGAPLKRRRYGLYAVLTLFLAGIVGLGMAEFLVRMVRPQGTYSRLLSTTGEYYTDGEFIPFTLKKDYVAPAPSMEFPGKKVTYSINSLGLRGPETTVEKPPGSRRILFLGDSYTFGIFCADDEVYPRALERLYARQTPQVEVLNAGYADGWSPDDHYAWLLKRGLSFRPDLVVYGFFIGNDIDDINTNYWVNLDQRGLPTRMVNPNIYVDYFGRIRSRRRDSKTVGTEIIFKVPLLRESHFFVLLNHVLLRRWPSSRFLLQSNPKTDGAADYVWPLAVDQVLSPQPSETMTRQLAIFFKLVQGMQEAAREAGADFLLLMIPINFQVEPDVFLKVLTGGDNFQVRRDPFKEMEPKLEELGIPYLNLLEAMKLHPEQKFYPRNGEVHFNPNGHRFAAEMLKQKLDERGWR